MAGWERGNPPFISIETSLNADTIQSATETRGRGTDFAMWAAVVVPLVEKFRVDPDGYQGHGASDVPMGSYTIPRLAEDVLAVMKAGHREGARVWPGVVSLMQPRCW